MILPPPMSISLQWILASATAGGKVSFLWLLLPPPVAILFLGAIFATASGNIISVASIATTDGNIISVAIIVTTGNIISVAIVVTTGGNIVSVAIIAAISFLWLLNDICFWWQYHQLQRNVYNQQEMHVLQTFAHTSHL